MLGKIINGQLTYPPHRIILNGMQIFNPTETQLISAGYKPIIEIDMPDDAPDGQHYEAQYTDGETQITQSWVLVKDEPTWVPDESDIENIRVRKREEISNTCENTIYNGIDIELSNGIKHFSLTQNDQINLLGLQTEMLDPNKNEFEYHSDGEPCIYYSREDMTKIMVGLMSFKKYQTTYCNSMFDWINDVKTVEELNNIKYGDDIPLEYQSEVLQNYLMKG